jgi:hypothetical protein
MIANVDGLSQVIEIDEFVVDIILAQVQKLNDDFHKAFTKYGKPYKELSESEKIPLRVITAEMEGLKSFIFQENLDKHFQCCIENEQYTGAEGIKNAKKWLIENKLN